MRRVIMKTKRFIVGMGLLLGIFVLCVSAAEKQSIKLRFFEGIKEGMVEPPPFVTSSYLHTTYTAHIRTMNILAEEQEELKKVFNLKDVRLITEADLQLGAKSKDAIKHTFRLNGSEYLVIIAQETRDKKRQYRLEVYETAKEDKNSLVDLEVRFPEDKSFICGFADKEGKPYFLSLGMPKQVTPETVGIVVGGAGGVSIEELERGAIKAVGEIKPPELIKKVDPVYPELARRAKVEGNVILNVRTDEEGRVDQIKVAQSRDPLLNRAAIDAVRQWQYQPFYYKGKLYPILFTVTIRFKLTDTEIEEEQGDKEEEVPTIRPQLIRRVEPIYPERARRAGIEGIVVLKIGTDLEGNVTSIVVLRSESTILNQAAIEAVEQWKYQPVYHNGRPIPVVTTVTVKFKLD